MAQFSWLPDVELPGNLSLLLLSSLSLLAVSLIVHQVRKWKLAKLARSYGCHEPTSRFPSSRLTGGLDYVFQFIPHIKKHRFAERAHELFNELGPTFVHSVLGKYVIHTIEPENLKTIMATNSEDYDVLPARATLTKSIYGDGIFATNGHEWTRSRKLVRDAMKRMTYDADKFQKHAELMIQELKSANSETVDFGDYAWRFTTHLTFDLFFGESVRSTDETQAQRSSVLTDGFAYLGQLGRSVTLYGRRIPYALALLHHGWRRRKESVESILDAHLLAARQEQQSKTTSDPSILDALPRKTNLVQAFAQSPADHTRARAEIMNLMLAGGDTIGVGLMEFVWQLARAPSVWAKLRAEVQDAFQGQIPALEDLKKLEYLRCILNEALRIHPTLSVHGRHSNRPTVLPRGGGPDGSSPIFVPANSYVVYSMYAQNRNQAVFGADVETFRPERWQRKSEKSTDGMQGVADMSRYDFLPFGAGVRACPGEKMGIMICAYALVRLAQEFEAVEARDERGWEEQVAFSFFNRFGCKVGFRG